MSGITDLADLFISVSEYVKRADFANLFPRFVALTEDRISQELRLEEESTPVTLTADTQGRVLLPVDFREARSVRLMGGNAKQLTGGSLQVLDATFEQTGIPAAFAIGGGYLNLRPRQAATIELTYWAGLSPLNAASPTNPILLRYSDCYLYGCIYQVLLWAADIEAAATVKELYDDAVMRAALDNEGRLIALNRLRRVGVTP